MKLTILKKFLLGIGLFMPLMCFSQSAPIRPNKTKSKPQQAKRTINQISEPDGISNGHGYVDLGLPSGTKWAISNIGSKSPDEFGDYYAFGELNTKNEYTEDNYSYKDLRISNIINSYDISGNQRFDVARTLWGSTWSMPNNSLWEELLNNCSWEIMTLKNSKGYKITGPNGKSIFLPASGEFSMESKPYGYGKNFTIAYWSSSIGEGPSCLYGNIENREGLDIPWAYGYEGLPIRPVLIEDDQITN